MTHFSHIFILYNPVSTGDSEKNARLHAKKLRSALPKKVTIDVIATEYAGHSAVLAEEYARTYPHCLIISSSGDGSYNEIINGVMASQSSTAVTGLLPSGNANDHYNALHKNDAVKLTAEHKIMKIDLLQIDGTSRGKKVRRFAHSYASIGLAPHIGEKLTAAKLNWFNEKWLVLKHLFTASPAKIIRNGRSYRYDHLVFSNTDTMSKYLTLAKHAKVDDGLFEVSGVKHKNAVGLLKYIIRVAMSGPTENLQVKSFRFICAKPTLIQLDGEVISLDNKSAVTVTSKKQSLRCIV